MDWTDARNLSIDAAQIAAVDSLREVVWAREHCRRIVVTAIYYVRSMSLLPPASHATLDRRCWLVFVNHDDHYTPGWTKVNGTLAAGDHPRSAHLVKIIPPLIFTQPVFYMDFKLTYCRSFYDEPLFRALQTPRVEPVGLFMSMHPRITRETVQIELYKTRVAMQKRHMARSVFYDLDAQGSRIERAGFRMNQTGVLPDCWLMLWPGHAVKKREQQIFARRWYYEVAHFSMREQTNFNWIASMVPGLNWAFVHRYYTRDAKLSDPARLTNGSTVGANGCPCNVERVLCPNASQPGVCAHPPRTLCPPPCSSDVEPSFLVERIAPGDTAGFQFSPPSPRCEGEHEAQLSTERCCRRRLAGLPLCKAGEG